MFLSSTDISVVILWWLSLRNIARTERLEQYFLDKAKTVKRLYYAHRAAEHESMDIRHEADELYKILSSYREADKIVIVAKSAGCIVALSALEHYPALYGLNMRYVFMWFPLGMSSSHASFADRFPTLQWYLLQNEFDPVGTYEDVRDAFEGSLFETVCLPWNTHHYEAEDLDKLNLKMF